MPVAVNGKQVAVILAVLDRKLDRVLETLARHTELLGRLDRGIGEVRLELSGIKSALNETLSEVWPPSM